MSKNIRLIYKENQDTGLFGWCIKGADWMDPTDAGGLAHDIMEHRRTDTGKFHEEIRAFGAALGTRRGTDRLYQCATGDKLIDIMGNDMGTGLVRTAYENKDYPDHYCDFTVMPKVIPKKDCKIEMEITAIAEAAAYEVVCRLGTQAADDEFDAECFRVSKWVAAWMISGFRWALNKYDRYGWANGTLFDVLANELQQEVIKGPPAELGDQYLITMELDRCWVSIRRMGQFAEDY